MSSKRITARNPLPFGQFRNARQGRQGAAASLTCKSPEDYNGSSWWPVRPFTFNRLRETFMRQRLLAVALLVAFPALAGVSCAKVAAKSAMKDGNKKYKEENFKRA